jgi:AraC-like DNA-binding protein
LTVHTSEQARFWYDVDLDNLELLRATYISHAFTPHAHAGFAIGIIEAGGQAFTYQRSTHLTMPAGSIAVINPGVVHTGRAATPAGWSYRMLYPSAVVLHNAASQVFGRTWDTPFFPSPVIHDTELVARIRQLHILLEETATPRLERESRLLWTLADLIIRHAQNRATPLRVTDEPTHVRRVREYLEQHFAENLTLDRLAQLVHLSPYHLLRSFRKTIGLPPHAYVLQLRVAAAKHALRQGMPIADVATHVGFADQSHLTRQFKRHVGVPPGHYIHS